MRSLLLCALLLGLVAAAAAQGVSGTRFANQGGPPDAVGVWWSNTPQPTGPITGIQLPDSYVFTYPSEDDPNQLVAEFGAYRTILQSRYTYPDGREETETLCEVGTVDLATGAQTWNSSPDECPQDFSKCKLTLLESSL